MRRLGLEREVVDQDVYASSVARFREAGIVIAFPQRDVHLDTLSPLEVRMVRDGAAPPQD